MAVQDLSGSGTIDPSQIPSECLSTTSHMESITVSTNGIAKLLKDLNPHKAAGPDKIDMFLKGYPLEAKIVSEYDQEIPQSQTADNPVAPRGRASQPSRDTRKTN